MDVQRWAVALDDLVARIGRCFRRSESRQHAREYLVGLLSSVERKNVWQLAEALGQPTPYALQQFLNKGPSDADDVRDEMRAYVVEHLGDEDGVMVVDETGFLKKGDKSVGVQRQYSGTAGRVENCQVGVFLTCATAKGSTFLDRALYLPRSWTDDRERCEAAGVPDDVTFATKPELAQAMLDRALDARVPAKWVTSDCVYGEHAPLRADLERRRVAYVLAVSRKMQVSIDEQVFRVSGLLESLEPDESWTRCSIADGSKGPRVYDWRGIPMGASEAPGWSHWLLVRRSITDPTDLTAYLCFAPDDTSEEALARVAGTRWTIESCFEEAKGEVGLDHYEVRGWAAWHRHITLACLAHAFLVVLRATEPEAAETLKKGGPLLALTGSLKAFKVRRGLSSA